MRNGQKNVPKALRGAVQKMAFLSDMSAMGRGKSLELKENVRFFLWGGGEAWNFFLNSRLKK